MIEEENRDIYKMLLHEVIYLTASTSVMKAPGGWIYRFQAEHPAPSTCFVPHNTTYK